MGYTSWPSYPLNTTDADFRQWGSAISAAMAAIGLTQASDTGQINWATVTHPAINTLGGYEIWRFNDSAQSTRPIYIRIEYRTGSVIDRPANSWTVGTGTNGAGTITGTILAAGTHSPLVATATPGHSFACYDAVTGTFWLALWHGHVSNSCTRMMAVARGWNADETAQETDYIGAWDWTATNFASAVVWRSTSTVTSNVIASSHPQHGFRWGPFETIYAGKWILWSDKAIYFPGFLTVGAGEILFGNEVPAAPLGAVEHNYWFLSLPNAAPFTVGYSGTSNANTRLLALWE